VTPRRGDTAAAWDTRVDEGETLIGAFSVLGSSAAEALAAGGLDFVLVDLQHGFATLDTVVEHLALIGATGAMTLVRVPDAAAGSIGSVLDRGAAAVVVPMIDTAEQAAAVVAATRYPPHGIRSYGPIRAGARERVEPGRRSPCFVMIETVAAVDAIDQIVAVPGLGGVYVGPTDLAISMGLGSGYDLDDAEHDGLVACVAAACQRVGLPAGVHTANAAVARRRAEQGFSLVSIGSDQALIADGVRRALTDLR